MRVQAVLLAIVLVACSETAEISVKPRPTPTPGASETAASLADRLKSLLASRNLPQMIHDAAEPFWQAAVRSNPITQRNCEAVSGGGGPNDAAVRTCNAEKAIVKQKADNPAVLEGAKVVKERLATEAKARGDGDEQFLTYMSLEIDAKAKVTSAASGWVNPEATPTPL